MKRPVNLCNLQLLAAKRNFKTQVYSKTKVPEKSIVFLTSNIIPIIFTLLQNVMLVIYNLLLVKTSLHR